MKLFERIWASCKGHVRPVQIKLSLPCSIYCRLPAIAKFDVNMSSSFKYDTYVLSDRHSFPLPAFILCTFNECVIIIKMFLSVQIQCLGFPLLSPLLGSSQISCKLHSFVKQQHIHMLVTCLSVSLYHTLLAYSWLYVRLLSSYCKKFLYFLTCVHFWQI